MDDCDCGPDGGRVLGLIDERSALSAGPRLDPLVEVVLLVLFQFGFAAKERA